VLKSVLKPCSVLALAAWSSYACAVNMGGIHVTSSYNQPLRAEIELVNLTEQERANLTARLAAPDAYTRAGAEYPANFPKLDFQLAKRPSGAAYLRVSSDEPVKQKLVSLIVELSWASGKTQHQYSFLLDAPDFVPVQPKPVEVKPLAPLVAATPAAAKSEPVAEPAATVTAKPLPAPAVEPKKAEEPKKIAAEHAAPKKRFVKVRKGDTLHKIARRYRPEEVSVERMVAALYRANKPAFEGRNMNRLEKGRVLRLPTEGELDAISQRRAVRLIRTHKIGLHTPVPHSPVERKPSPAEYETPKSVQPKPPVPVEHDKPKEPIKEEQKPRLPKLSALSEEAKAEAAREAGREPPKPTQKETPKQEMSGKVGAGNLQADVAREQAQEVLRLSKGIDEQGGRLSRLDGQVRELQDKLNANEEDRIAKEKSLKDHNERIAVLEKNVEELRRLVALKNEAGGLTVKPLETPKQDAAVSAPEPAASLEPASATEAVSAPAAVSSPVSAPVKAKPAEKKEEKTGSLLSSPVVLGGAAALLLALGGIGYWIFKRGRKPAAPVKKTVRKEPEAAAETEAEPVAAAVAEEVAPADEAMETALDDVLKEEPAAPVADEEPAVPFADVLEQTMTAQPEPEAPVEEAITADDWAKAIEEQAAPQPASEPAPLPDDVAVDLSFGTDFAAPEETASEVPKAMSADQMAQAISKLTQEYETSLAQQTEEAVPEPVAPDEFSAPAAEPETPAPATLVAEPEAVAPAPAMEAPPFAIDIPVFGKEASASTQPVASPVAPQPSVAPAPTQVPPAAAMLQEIDLDLSGVQNAAPVPEEAKDAHWHEVATKLDLARAYHEMGDSAGAREILDEVLAEGDAQQQAAANEMLQQLSA